MSRLAPGGGAADADEQPRPGRGRAAGRARRLRRNRSGRALVGGVRRPGPHAANARGRRDHARPVREARGRVSHARVGAARADRELQPRRRMGDLGRVPPARGARADDVRPDDGGLVDLHRQPGDRAGHVRVLRGDRPPALRWLAGRHRHAHRRTRRHGRGPAARGDDERGGRAVRGGRPRSHPPPARDPLPRRGGGRSRRRGRALHARQAGAACAQRRPVRERRRGPSRAAPPGLRGGRGHRPDQRARPARRLRARRPDARRGRRPAPRRSRRVHPPRAPLGGRPLLRDGRLHGRRRGGLRLRQQPARRGEAGRLRARVRLPGLRPGLHPAAVLRGQGAVPLGGAVGRPGGHRRHRPRRARGVPRGREPRPLDPHGGRADRVPGAARADLLARLRRAAPARAPLQRDGARAASCGRRS